MKIAIIASNRRPIPSPINRIFAPGLIIEGLSEGLVKKGHEVYLFAPEGTKTNANLITAGTRSLYEEFSVGKDFEIEKAMRSEDYFAQDLQYQLLLDSTAFEFISKNNFDIVHSHNPRYELYFSSFAKAPCLFTFHDAEREVAFEIDKKRMEKYAKNNYFVSISDAQRKVLGNLNWAGTVYNGIDLNFYKFSNGGGKLIFSGQMIRQKGVDTAVKLAIEKNRPLLIAGDVSKTAEGKKVFDEISPYFDNKLVSYMGHVKYNEMQSVYKQGKVLLMPIRWQESFGLVMVEAMACGTPVIAYDLGAVREIVEDGKTGFICQPGNTQSMAKAIEAIYSMSPTDYENMRKACRERVENYFTLEKMVTNYEKVYGKVVSDWKQRKI